MRLLVIALGGALGALARYFLTGWVQALTTSLFPLGTLVVNASGCFAFGVLGTLLMGAASIPEHYRSFLLIGFLGAFTTFSTFAWNTLALFDDGRVDLAVANVVSSNLLCLLGVWLGYRLVSS